MNCVIGFDGNFLKGYHGWDINLTYIVGAAVFQNAVSKGVRSISFGDLLGNLGTTMYDFSWLLASKSLSQFQYSLKF